MPTGAAAGRSPVRPPLFSVGRSGPTGDGERGTGPLSGGREPSGVVDRSSIRGAGKGLMSPPLPIRPGRPSPWPAGARPDRPPPAGRGPRPPTGARRAASGSPRRRAGTHAHDLPVRRSAGNRAGCPVPSAPDGTGGRRAGAGLRSDGMKHISGDRHPGPTRRALLAAGAGAALAAGCTRGGASGAPAAASSGSAPPTAAAGDLTPGAMTLFKDPAYNFNGLLALGGSGAGAAEVGEVLTAVNTINGAGLTAQTYVQTFRALGDQLLEAPRVPRQTARPSGSGRCAPPSTTRRRCSSSSARTTPAARKRCTRRDAGPGTPSAACANPPR